MTKTVLEPNWTVRRKLLACGLSITLSLYAIPLSSSQAFGEELDVAQGLTDGQSAEEQVAEPRVDGAQVGSSEEGEGVITMPENKTPIPGEEQNVADEVELVGQSASAIQSGEADADESSQDATSSEVIEEVYDGVTDEEIAETLSVFDDAGSESEGAQLLSLGGGNAVTTYGGATMFETAVAEAKAAFSQSDTVIIAGPGDAWVDALAAAGLAGALDCPILFTETDSLHPATKQALKDLGVKNAIIVGGPAAIGNQVVDELNSVGVALKKRLGGVDCFDTQMKIYEYGVENSLWNYGLAIVATGGHYGDALSASPIAFDKKAPIFLVENGDLRTPQKNALSNAAKNGQFSTTAIVGGPAAVSERTQGFLSGMSICTRYGGATQYETSTEIAKWAVSSQGFSWNNAAFTTGESPYDALAGSVLQGKSRSVMLLVRDASSASIKEASASKAAISAIRFFGGTAAVSPSVRTYIVSCLTDLITYEHAGVSLSYMAGLEKQSASVVDPDQYSYEDSEFYQFAIINGGYSGKTSAAQLNTFIAKYGADGKLAGMGQAFIDAANTYGTNEVYLLSHAILESGWGKSDLAKGYAYDGKTEIGGKTYPAGTYYNFFGIGAYDSSPLSGGRAAAIINGWDTPEKAITGAAKWIATEYANNAFSQNTLYKMRWNYTQAARSGAVWKQYATSTTWATGIANVMSNCYASIGLGKDGTGLKYLVPMYS